MTDVTRPVKRVTGETVEDRLTRGVLDEVLPARYLQRDEEGNVVEEPAEMFRRVAENVATAEDDPEQWADRFEELMAGLVFLPNSPTLMNAGGGLQQLAACFVLSPDDSLDSIFETVGRAAKIFQSGGGTGYSFSRLRPQGDLVHTTGGTAAGPVPFMRIFDEMCEQVKQGGKRRGAQMATLRVDHPDIGRFCVAKREEGHLSNFNISVGVTDEFVDAVTAGERYDLVNPRTGDHHEATAQTAQFYSPTYEDADPTAVEANLWRDAGDEIPGLDQYRDALRIEEGERVSLPAEFVWTLVVDGAWRNGEPGLFAVERANADHSFDVGAHPDHRIETTNPCGEQPLENYEACNLGHVNLSLLVADDRTVWPDHDADLGADADAAALERAVERFLEQAIDWERLRAVARDGTRFLDDVVTMSDYPIPAIEETVGRLRKVGLGVMGLAELLVQLGIDYDSAVGREVAGQLMAAIDHESARTSHELALERGCFDDWADSKYADPTGHPAWFERHTGFDPSDWADGFPIRNHGTTSIAPTGTTSMIANSSPGCEPIFDVVYAKRVTTGPGEHSTLVEFNDYFIRTLAANGIDVERVRQAAVDRLEEGSYDGPSSLPVPDAIADLFVTADEVAPRDHVRMQARLQEHVDGAISKTINLPHDADREDVERAYETAYEEGCKGITVFRAGSREEQGLSTDGEDGA